MAKKSKQPEFIHCKVTLTTHPKAPWRVSFPVEENGVTRRKRRMFAKEEKAREFAAGHEKDVIDHGVRFGSITAEARRAFDAYRDARHDLRAEGIEPPTFEALVADAVASLRKQHADRQRHRVTVADAVEAFKAYKATRVGPRHKAALKSDLKRFAVVFGDHPVDSVTSAEIEAWLGSLRSARSDGQAISPQTRNKLRKILKALFGYASASAQSWCPRNPLSDIAPEKVKLAEPKAYTPAETAAILNAALAMKSPLLPELALGFFAGLRPTETMLIDLSAIRFDAEEFRVPAGTKTGPRIAPLTPSCKAWLAAQTRRTGAACPLTRKAHSLEMQAVLKAAGVRSIYDGRRHSFITYRTAEKRDVARVADECGNSPNIIKKHYRQLVTSEAAKEFFAIRPVVVGKSKITNIEEGRISA
jgi:site-specific recombinase XerD